MRTAGKRGLSCRFSLSEADMLFGPKRSSSIERSAVGPGQTDRACLRLGLLGGFTLLQAGARQHVGKRVVPFMASILVHLLVRTGHRVFRRPR